MALPYGVRQKPSLVEMPAQKMAVVRSVGDPYSEEEPTIARLHAFIAESGYEIAGPHEEEYLSKPEAKNMKTIIRYPVKPQ